MTEQQVQTDRDFLFTIHADYSKTVTLMRGLKACAKDEQGCPCAECIILRRFLKFRDRAWNAYLAISEKPEESASQEVVEAAAGNGRNENAA